MPSQRPPHNSPTDESAEMGPDAYGGYFLAHAKGSAYDARRRQEVGYLDAAIGDCRHSHGTPTQRKAAAAWGEHTATRQADPNRILPTATMVAEWNDEYPKLDPPDAAS